MEQTVKKPKKRAPSRRANLQARPTIGVLILRYFDEHPGVALRKDIKDYLYENGGFISFNTAARAMINDGILINPRPGYYALAPEADDTPPTTATP